MSRRRTIPLPEGPETLTFALASYLAAANGQRLAAYLGTASGLAVFVVAELVIGPPIIARVVMVLAWTLVVPCAGELTRYDRAYRAESRRRAAEAELMREEELRRRSKARPLCMVLPTIEFRHWGGPRHRTRPASMTLVG